MFGLNLFDLGRFTETTTILWLRIIAVIGFIAGMYLAGFIGIGLAIFSISALLVYLLFGATLASYMTSDCVYCPSSPIRLSMTTESHHSVPGIVPLPETDPFSHTALYYLTVDSFAPAGSGSMNGNSIIERVDLYDIVVDNNTGALGIRTAKSDTPVYFGNLPTQTFVQLAIIHDEKEIRVFVNGVSRGSMLRDNLPPTSSMRSQYIINQSGAIRNGILYQVHMHKGNVSVEELMNANERQSIQYVNDCTFQNTQYPTDEHRAQMSTADVMMGYMRMIMGTFGYTTGVSIADMNVKHK